MFGEVTMLRCFHIMKNLSWIKTEFIALGNDYYKISPPVPHLRKAV